MKAVRRSALQEIHYLRQALAFAEAQQKVDIVYGAFAFKKMDVLLLGDLADELRHGLVDVILE